MLDQAFPGRVQPVKFTQPEKSAIGWRFLSIIERGRFRDCSLKDAVRAQYEACRSETLPGPARTLRWGVPEDRRGPQGELLHDDLLLADSLVARLDRLEWTTHTEPLIVRAQDPLKGMEGRFSLNILRLASRNYPSPQKCDTALAQDLVVKYQAGGFIRHAKTHVQR